MGWPSLNTGFENPIILVDCPLPPSPAHLKVFFCGIGIENIHDQKILLQGSPPTPQIQNFKLRTNFGLYSPTRLLPGETRGTNYDWNGLIPKSRPGLNLRMFVSGFGNVRLAQSAILDENKKYSAVSEQCRLVVCSELVSCPTRLSSSCPKNREIWHAMC